MVKEFVLPNELIELSNPDKFVKLSNLILNNRLDHCLIRDKYQIVGEGDKIHGIYSFWYIGDELPTSKKLEIKVRENDNPIAILFTPCDLFIHQPLYVGKTTNFFQRIKQHILISNIDYRRSLDENNKFHHGRMNKLTTSCQFRAGFEYLFDGKRDLEFCFENVAVSFVEIPNGPNNNGVKTRFYLEDLAIGIFQPWFNVDSER